MIKKKRLAGWLAAAMLASGATQAALLDRGGGMIYDSDLNITWLADSNYAKTSGYDADGLMTWSAATSWANQLVFGGYTDWRLPTTLQPDPTCLLSFNAGAPYGVVSFGPNCSGSEMGHLAYLELGGGGSLSILGSGDPDLNLFHNIQSSGYYWSSTAYGPDPGQYWVFSFFGIGDQATTAQNNDSGVFAWAVRTGDVAAQAVPEPDGVSLVGLALAVLAATWRRRSLSAS